MSDIQLPSNRKKISLSYNFSPLLIKGKGIKRSKEALDLHRIWKNAKGII